MTQKATKGPSGVFKTIGLILFTIVFFLLAGKIFLSIDKKEIKKNTKMPEKPTDIQLSRIDKIDRDKLLMQYITTEVSESDKITLAPDGGILPESMMLPVYNAIFNKDGIQAASLSDTNMTCYKDALNPLGEMLGDFYDQTGLRTIMVEQAYIAPEGGSDGYYDHNGNYIEGSPAEISEMSTGMCIHLALYDENYGARQFEAVKQYNWFVNNSYKYGFILRYPNDKENITGKPYDPALYRYVGKAAAYVIHENGLCLEELAEFMKDKDYDNCLIVPAGRPVMLYTLPHGSELKIPATSDGQPSTFKSYEINETTIIEAVPDYIPMLDSPSNKSSEETSDAT